MFARWLLPTRKAPYANGSCPPEPNRTFILPIALTGIDDRMIVAGLPRCGVAASPSLRSPGPWVDGGRDRSHFDGVGEGNRRGRTHDSRPSCQAGAVDLQGIDEFLRDSIRKPFIGETYGERSDRISKVRGDAGRSRNHPDIWGPTHSDVSTDNETEEGRIDMGEEACRGFDGCYHAPTLDPQEKLGIIVTPIKKKKNADLQTDTNSLLVQTPDTVASTPVREQERQARYEAEATWFRPQSQPQWPLTPPEPMLSSTGAGGDGNAKYRIGRNPMESGSVKALTAMAAMAATSCNFPEDLHKASSRLGRLWQDATSAYFNPAVEENVSCQNETAEGHRAAATYYEGAEQNEPNLGRCASYASQWRGGEVKKDFGTHITTAVALAQGDDASAAAPYTLSEVDAPAWTTGSLVGTGDSETHPHVDSSYPLASARNPHSRESIESGGSASGSGSGSGGDGNGGGGAAARRRQRHSRNRQSRAVGQLQMLGQETAEDDSLEMKDPNGEKFGRGAKGEGRGQDQSWGQKLKAPAVSPTTGATAAGQQSVKLRKDIMMNVFQADMLKNKKESGEGLQPTEANQSLTEAEVKRFMNVLEDLKLAEEAATEKLKERRTRSRSRLREPKSEPSSWRGGGWEPVADMADRTANGAISPPPPPLLLQSFPPISEGEIKSPAFGRLESESDKSSQGAEIEKGGRLSRATQLRKSFGGRDWKGSKSQNRTKKSPRKAHMCLNSLKRASKDFDEGEKGLGVPAAGVSEERSIQGPSSNRPWRSPHRHKPELSLSISRRGEGTFPLEVYTRAGGSIRRLDSDAAVASPPHSTNNGEGEMSMSQYEGGRLNTTSDSAQRGREEGNSRSSFFRDFNTQWEVAAPNQRTPPLRPYTSSRKDCLSSGISDRKWGVGGNLQPPPIKDIALDYKLQESISELTMRSRSGFPSPTVAVNGSAGVTHAVTQQVEADQRRMAYYAVGRDQRQVQSKLIKEGTEAERMIRKLKSQRGGNRRCYFTGRPIPPQYPFYAGSVQQGLRTLVVFCLPSAIGLPGGDALRRLRPIRKAADSVARGHGTVDDENQDPNCVYDPMKLLISLPDPDASLLQIIKSVFPEQFATLPAQVRGPHCWRLFTHFCFFSGLPVAEGELHYRVRNEVLQRDRIASDGKNDIHDDETLRNVVLSHEVVETVHGTISGDMVRLPSQRVFQYLMKHYLQQSSKLPRKAFKTGSWELMHEEV